jgi:hypothetical protein
MNFILGCVVLYFLFSGDPPLIDVLHERVMQSLEKKT